MMEVCKGLAYAHELHHPETGQHLDIVHRDISPPNVLLSRNGRVKVADFGLAKAAENWKAPIPGVVKGKLSYLSPEAARGETVDRRGADIFAVGILLYEMLTGRRLFYGQTDYQTVELVRAGHVPQYRGANPDVDPDLEDIVRKALATDTEDRFQNANDFRMPWLAICSPGARRLSKTTSPSWFGRALRKRRTCLACFVRLAPALWMTG